MLMLDIVLSQNTPYTSSNFADCMIQCSRIYEWCFLRWVSKIGNSIGDGTTFYLSLLESKIHLEILDNCVFCWF